VEPGISDRLSDEGGLDLQHKELAIQAGQDVDFPGVLLFIRRIPVEHHPETAISEEPRYPDLDALCLIASLTPPS
jgi:hypothetical protein